MPGNYDYSFIITGDSVDGGIMKSPVGETRTTNSIDVESVDKYLAQIVEWADKLLFP